MPWDLQERTRLFAIAVVAFCRRLPGTAEAQEAAGQLRRAANAVRSNYRAARHARSRREFQAKLGTVLEEIDECVDWLTYLHDVHISRDPPLLQESRELARIFAAAIRTTRGQGRHAPKVEKSTSGEVKLRSEVEKLK